MISVAGKERDAAELPGRSAWGVRSSVPRIESDDGATPGAHVDGVVAMTMATAANVWGASHTRSPAKAAPLELPAIDGRHVRLP